MHQGVSNIRFCCTLSRLNWDRIKKISFSRGCYARKRFSLLARHNLIHNSLLVPKESQDRMHPIRKAVRSLNLKESKISLVQGSLSFVFGKLDYQAPRSSNAPSR